MRVDTAAMAGIKMTEPKLPPFRELVQDHLPWLYRLARRLCGDDAEDVVQEALVKAHRRLDSLRNPEAVSSWMRQIVINCARDRLRAEMRRKETPAEDLERYSLYRTVAEEDPFPYSDSLHLDFLSVFDDEDVWAVLDRLPRHYRMPLALVHMEGFATKDAARLMGEPLGLCSRSSTAGASDSRRSCGTTQRRTTSWPPRYGWRKEQAQRDQL